MTDEAPNSAHMAMHLQPSSTTLAAAGAMPDQDFLLVLDMLHAACILPRLNHHAGNHDSVLWSLTGCCCLVQA